MISYNVKQARHAWYLTMLSKLGMWDIFASAWEGVLLNYIILGCVYVCVIILWEGIYYLHHEMLMQIIHYQEENSNFFGLTFS
jgi:fumarate reductase subunit D